MFEKEAEEYVKQWIVEEDVNDLMQEAFQDGAEFGYNKGYHDAEEHYLNVIDSQHKLVDESKKKDFRKCMKCTNGTYQSGFKDGYNKANEWHYPSKGEYPKDEKKVLCILGDFENDNLEVGYYSQVEGDSKRWRFEDYDLPDDSEDGWGVSAWKEIVLPKEIKENE